MIIVRGLTDSDHIALLRLNAANSPAVAQMDATELRRLAGIGRSHLVVLDAGGMTLGYVLAFASDDPYDGEEFQHFKARLPQPFLYVDQLAIDRSGRRLGSARALYEALGARARERAAETICCEVNLDPPNPGSMAFHLRMGFVQIAAIATRDGRTVALMTCGMKSINHRS